MKKQSVTFPRQLKTSLELNPMAPQESDEYYVNGIFYFNITNLKNEIDQNKANFTCIQTKVSYWRVGMMNDLNSEYVEAADLECPLILAEIAPDRFLYYSNINPDDWQQRGYNLINGHHRIEKAHRAGISELPAYIVPMEVHIRFMYSGFDKYVEYWNRKLVEYASAAKRVDPKIKK